MPGESARMTSQEAGHYASLFDLIKERRQELIDRWMRETRLENTADFIATTELLDHIPRFVDELIMALHPEALPLPALGESSLEHGAQRLSLGFNVGEVVREYGTLTRCILEIAEEAGISIKIREQQVMSRLFTSGIANALSQYVSERDADVHRSASEHLGFIAHEIRNPLSSARMAFEMLRRGDLKKGGRGVDLLDRNLRRISDVIDNALSHASLKLGVVPHIEQVRLRKFLDEIGFDGSAQIEEKDLTVLVEVADDLTIEADARLLRSAVSNLFHNAIKFTRPNTEVTLRATVAPGVVQIEVEDGCGGLPPGRAQDLFTPLVQRGADHSGFGLGLSIALQAVEAHNGTIRVRDLPGQGCVFTIDLPARTTPTT